MIGVDPKAYYRVYPRKVDAMTKLTIGKIANAAGLGVETVRFYERRGLLPPPARSASGYRLYDTEIITRLNFIGRAKGLGFTLNEICELLALRTEPQSCCDSVRSRAAAKIADIESRVEQLLAMKAGLRTLVDACDDNEVPGTCPLLNALDVNPT